MKTTWILSGYAAAMLIAAAACSGSVETGGGSAGNGGSGPGGSGSGGSGGQGGQVPLACQVQTMEAAPYKVVFQFENPGNSNLYLREDCHLNFDILACADGYASAISRYGDCTVDCSAPPGGCIACGACFEQAITVAPAGMSTGEWLGYTYTFSTQPDGCSCHNQYIAPAAKYRIRVPVFASEMDAQSFTPMFSVEKDFDLPAPGGIVNVVLAPPAP